MYSHKILIDLIVNSNIDINKRNTNTHRTLRNELEFLHSEVQKFAMLVIIIEYFLKRKQYEWKIEYG